MLRSEYMNHPCHLVSSTPEERAKVHRQYYSQFVNTATIACVVSYIGADALKASTDPHLNDIPLKRWDTVAQASLPVAVSFKSVGDYATLSGLVCVAKEAARQWLEAQANKDGE